MFNIEFLQHIALQLITKDDKSMSTINMKNKSYRLSEKIGELLKERQITTNQLFEAFIILAE